jgi:hypothetical protein
MPPALARCPVRIPYQYYTPTAVRRAIHQSLLWYSLGYDMCLRSCGDATPAESPPLLQFLLSRRMNPAVARCPVRIPSHPLHLRILSQLLALSQLRVLFLNRRPTQTPVKVPVRLLSRPKSNCLLPIHWFRVVLHPFLLST